MTEVDKRYIQVFAYDLTGSIIERIELQKDGLNLYLSTHRMDIPENVPRQRDDMCYLLSIMGIQAMASDFPLTGEEVERQLNAEGNEIHDYGFLDEQLAPAQTPDALAVYFETDWGLLEIAAASITYTI